ncbi:MAG: hypothetical protein E5X15_32765, partial [Mesorhizobium sp.]
PELRRFLQRLLTTLERNSAAGAGANGAAKPIPQPAEPAAPGPNGHGAERMGAEARGAESMASVASYAEPGAGLPDRITS